MKLINKIENYLSDNEYRIIIKENSINIINYDEILDFSLTKISIRSKQKIIIIEGKNLIISKMLEDEILVIGNITNIRIN